MTAKTPAQLKAEVATSFPDNTTGFITPAIMRTFQDDIIDSFSTGAVATSDTTWYVATNGNDSNPGTVGSPFLTIQHAISVAASYDWQDIYSATIQVADGTYSTGDIDLPSLNNPAIAGANLIGNTTTPANCILDGCSLLARGARSVWNIRGFQIQPIDRASAIYLDQNATVSTSDVNAGGQTNRWGFVYVDHYSNLNIGGTITFTRGVCGDVMQAFTFSTISWQNSTINFPATFTINSFIETLFFCSISFYGNSFTNFAGVSGRTIDCTQSVSLLTANGVETDLPGTPGTIVLDATCTFIKLSFDAAGRQPSQTYGIIKAAAIGTQGYEITGLPASPVQGTRAYVTNALTPVWGSPVAGTGSAVVPVFFDGSNWIVG